MKSATLGVPATIFALLVSGSGCGEAVFDDEADLRGMTDSWVDPNEPDLWADVASTAGEGETGRDPESCKLSQGFADGDKTQLAYSAVTVLAHDAGVPCGYNLVKAVAVAAGESGRYQYAYHQNKNCSLDRGLWQVNSKYWGDHSTYELEGNAKAMALISSNGKSWTPWIAYLNGGYKKFLGSACVAVKELCGKSYCN
jgi:hypothetical protein